MERGLEGVGVVALRNADPACRRAKPAAAELTRGVPLRFLVVEMEADQIAARSLFWSIRAGAFVGGIADIVGAGIHADVVPLNRALAAANLAGGGAATEGRIGVTDADRPAAAGACSAPRRVRVSANELAILAKC